MSKKQYELTAGQIWGLRQMFALTSSANELHFSRRLSLIEMLDFTAEEREQIEYMELPGGRENDVAFTRDAVLTRQLTPGQRKMLLQTCIDALPRVHPDFCVAWVYPAMLALGYKLPEPEWDEEEGGE